VTSKAGKAARTVLAVTTGVLALVYPLLIYVGLTRFSARHVGLVALIVLIPSQLLRHRRRKAVHLRALAFMPLGVGALLALAAWIDDQRFVLALPVLINLFLLGAFASTLRGEMPIIERFARMQVEDLPAEEIDYCRSVTRLWCLFFACNALTAGLLAFFAPLTLWTLYNGAISYGIMGLLFAIELFVRKARFKRFGDGVLDRLIFSRLFASRS